MSGTCGSWDGSGVCSSFATQRGRRRTTARRGGGDRRGGRRARGGRKASDCIPELGQQAEKGVMEGRMLRKGSGVARREGSRW